MRVAREIDALLLGTRHQDLAEACNLVDQAAASILALAAGNWERMEIRRRLAELKLMLACIKGNAWPEVEGAYLQVAELGFSSTARRVQDTVNVTRWCADHATRLDAAAELLLEARRQVRRLRRSSKLRRRLEKQVEEFLALVEEPQDHQGEARR